MKTKGITAVLCAAVMLMCFAFTSYAADVSVELDGKPIEFDVKPFIENDRTLVPLRKIFEAVGADVNWDEATRTVVVRHTKNGEPVMFALQIDNTRAFINNDEEYILDVPARIVDDRTFVPLRFVAETLGNKVEWDADTYTVEITSEKN